VCSQYHAASDKPTAFGTNCRMDRNVSWAPLSYASSFAFDTFILILTIWKLPDNNHVRSPVGYIIFRDSLLYFFVTAATNLIVLAVQSMGPEFNSIKPAAVPFSTLITTTMGCRLFLNLKLYHQRETERITPFIYHSRSASGDDGEQRATLLPSNDSPVPQKPLALITHGKHLPPRPPERGPRISMCNNTHERDRSEDRYICRALPPVPPPQPILAKQPVPVRQSVPQDVYSQEQEFDAFLKDDELRLVGSPV
jgi:hypothetical protein